MTTGKLRELSCLSLLHAVYRYWHGLNWRAPVAWVLVSRSEVRLNTDSETSESGFVAESARFCCYRDARNSSGQRHMDVCWSLRLSLGSCWLILYARHVYYLSWPLAFCISATVWVALNTMWPPRGLGEVDEDSEFLDSPEKESTEEKYSSSNASPGDDLEYK